MNPQTATTTTTTTAKRLLGAALIALAATVAPLTGPLGPRAAQAEETVVTYAAAGNWHAAIRTVVVTTASGAVVRLPLHLYVPGPQHLDAARAAQVTQTQKPGARGGTDVEVTVRLAATAGAKAFGTNGAVRGVDVPDGEGLFVQRGGNSDRPLVFSFHLDRA